MVLITVIAGIVHPGTSEKRNLVLFRFYCDESFDGKANNPDVFTVSGFFSDQITWEEVEKDWGAVNKRFGVSEFHATELNARKKEYDGWDDDKQRGYSSDLLQCVTKHKHRMRAYNCGIRGDAYRNIISGEGQSKLGHPWMVCFNSCVAMIAKDMEELSSGDTFSVVFGRENRFEGMAVESFGKMKDNPLFPYRHRLMTCTPGSSKQIIPLQVADLMAYEYFKRLKSLTNHSEMRIPLSLIRQHNAFCEGFFGEDTFTKMKTAIEAAICAQGRLVIIPAL